MMFATVLALKIGALGSVGVGIASALKLFHNYEWKQSSKKGVKYDDNYDSESLREKARRIN